MKFQAKIKSISQYSIKGNRLLPAQIVTNDSNKSIKVQDNLSNSSFTNNSRSFAQECLPEVSRFSNRHTTDITGLRQVNLRLSLDQINKNRSLEAQQSIQGNLSDRKSIQGSQSQNKVINGSGSGQKQPIMLRKLIMGDSSIDVFKDLRIQKITSNQAKMDRNFFENATNGLEQLHNHQVIQRQSTKQDSSSPHDNIWEKLYTDYKAKCNLLQKDNKQMANRMRDSDVFIQKLQKQNEILLANVNKSQQKIEQQAKRLLKLQESIKINRSINEQMMKKQRESQRKMKIIEENNEFALKRRVDEIRTQITQQVKQKYDESLLNYQREVFELKLKLFDQANQFQQSHRAMESALAQLQDHKNQLLENIASIYNQKQYFSSQFQFIRRQLQSRAANLSQIIQQKNNLQASIHQANEQISKLTSQIIRMDQQNLRLDQQNIRMSQESQNNMGNANDQINQLINRCIILERQKDELVESIESKDALLAQLNITKNNALLQVLSLKNELKKKRQNDQKQHKGKDQQIKSLKEQILQKTAQSQQAVSEVIGLNEELKALLANAKLQFERQYSERWKQNEDLMNESLLFKLQILQQLKKSSQESKLLKAQLQTFEKINEQLKNRNAKFQEERDILEQLIKSKVQTILKLNEEINEFKKRQIQKSETMKQKQSNIQSRQNDLKEVQQQYLELIQGELKKIHNMSDNQWDLSEVQYTDRFQITPINSKRSYDQFQEGLSPQHSPLKAYQQAQDSPQEPELSELAMKVQELTFVNEALQQKVASLTEFQENSNAIILQKIRSFEQHLEKTLHEKHEVEYQNIELLRRMTEVTQKCISYEAKIEWLENIYRCLQENLFQTQQELLKIHFQYVNLKLQSQIQQDCEDELLCQQTNEDNFISNDPKSPQEMLSNEIPSFEEQKQQHKHPEMIQEQIYEDCLQNKKETDQLVLQSLLPHFPEILINILAVSSEDDDWEENEHPKINYILVSSEDQDDEQQQIIEKKECPSEQDQKIEEAVDDKLELHLQFFEQFLPKASKQQSLQSIVQDLIKNAICSIQNKIVFPQNGTYIEHQTESQQQNDDIQVKEEQNKLDMVE